jgi:CPA2 family monovalent cation:H+ antiporter-2
MVSGLELTLLLLGSAVLGVVAFRMLHLPPMLGYLAVGVLIGPHALGLAQEDHTTSTLAEFGVVFLMFSIGLEFSLAQLRAMRRIVFGLGLAQVVLTIAATMLFGWAINRFSPYALSWQAAFALGGALAMSSTAIVSKMLTERLELESQHGRRSIGILLFQDLAVVPLIIMIPALAQGPEKLAATLGWAAVKATLVLVVLLFFGQKLMRKWFTVVVKRRSQELFMLNLLLVTLGAAWITEQAGLSLALGAFVAGMLISETQYKHQVEEDIKPFRDVLLGLFFITIGMLLNVELVLRHWALVLLLLTVPVLLKFALIALLAKGFGSWMMQSLQLTQIASRTMAAQKHVIIAGFGRSGQSLATLLAEEKLVYYALDLDPERVQEAQAAGANVSYGDAARRESLIAAGVHRASALVVTFADTHAALKVLHLVHELAPSLPVIVRSYDDTDLETLKQAGATEVVPEALEGSLMLASHALVMMGVPLRRVVHRVQSARDERYASLRGYFHGAGDASDEPDHLLRLHSVTLGDGAASIGKRLADLALADVGAEVTTLRRGRVRIEVTQAMVFEAGDVVVVRGAADAVTRAEGRLLQ